MRIVLFAIVHVNKFDKKSRAYQGVKSIEWQQDPLELVGLMANAFDLNIGQPVEIYFLIQDAKTGHRPEDGNINGEALVHKLNEAGFYIFNFEHAPEE